MLNVNLCYRVLYNWLYSCAARTTLYGIPPVRNSTAARTTPGLKTRPQCMTGQISSRLYPQRRRSSFRVDRVGDAYSFTLLRRRELVTTDTDESAMAAAAYIGFSRPRAAIGMPQEL